MFKLNHLCLLSIVLGVALPYSCMQPVSSSSMRYIGESYYDVGILYHRQIKEPGDYEVTTIPGWFVYEVADGYTIPTTRPAINRTEVTTDLAINSHFTTQDKDVYVRISIYPVQAISTAHKIKIKNLIHITRKKN